MQFEYDRLIEPLTTPDRPRLAEVDSVVENAKTAAEAWESLAARGLIPLSWMHSDERGFTQPVSEPCKPCNGSGMTNAGWSNCYLCNATGSVLRIESNLTTVFATPQDVRTCAAVASMSHHMATAEALATEFATQLEILGISQPIGHQRPFRWRLGAAALEGMERGDSTKCAVNDCESPHFFNHTFHSKLKTMIPPIMNSAWANVNLVRARATRLVYAHASWNERAKRGERLRASQSIYGNQPLRELTNPYTVALEICALGFAIEDVIDGIAFLLVPPR